MYDARNPHSALTLVTAPALEPVTLADAKLFARISTSADDAIVTSLIQTAREWLETWTRRAFVTQTWKLALDNFPIYYDWYEYSPYQTTAPYQSASQWQTQNIIRLPVPPLQSVSLVQYIDTSGVLQTLAAVTGYQVDAASEPGRIAPAYGTFWPSVQAQISAVTIQFVAGYDVGGGAKIPSRVQTAIKMAVASWYQNREMVGLPLAEQPLALRSIVSSLKWGNYV